MSRTRIAILGPLEVRRSDPGDNTPAGFPEASVVAIGSPLQRRLLAALAVHAGEVVPVDRLADIVWAGEPPQGMASSLQNLVYRLRAAIGQDVIATIPPGYTLRVSADDIDWRRFERLIFEATSSSAAAALEQLDAALSLWKGSPLSEFEYEDWARPTIVRLDALRSRALERRIEALFQLGRTDEASVSAQALVGEDPIRERAVALLMQSLAAEGRTVDALRAAANYRAELADHTGLTAAPSIDALERRLLEQDSPARTPEVSAGQDMAKPGSPQSGGRTTSEDGSAGTKASAARDSTPELRLPSGVVTFLFTDIAGSTELWTREPIAMRAALRMHDEILRSCLARHRGYVFATSGDSFAAAFQQPDDAIAAALLIQEALAAASWPERAEIQVRIGAHLGVADERDGNYFGPSVSKAARVEQAAHGGQIVITGELASHVEAEVRPLGEHRLRGFDAPVLLFQVDSRSGRTTFPPLRTAVTSGPAIPMQRASLIGRDDAVVEIRQLLADHRFVSLIGPGGIGKTSLAAEVASREAARGTHTVFFIDLSGVPVGGDVVPAFLAGLGLRGDSYGHPRDKLVDELSNTSALLVIDNCEQVLDQVASVIALLEPCRLLRFLATSRESLAIPGERVWRVPALEIRPTAIRLFEDRATGTDSTFRIGPGDEAIIAEICEHLDGLPLAIELAASRVRSLSLSDIRDGLDRRFRLLAQSGRTVTSRQKTLETAIAWSYDLLSEHERSVFRSIAVFHESFDLADVAGLTGLDEFAAIDVIDALVAKSMVEPIRAVTRPGGRPSSSRYRLLESLRSFALDRLTLSGERTRMLDRHLAHMVVRDGAPEELRTATSRARVHVRDFANLRAAANWALESGRAVDATRLALGRTLAFIERGLAKEGLAWLSGRNGLSTNDHLWALNGCAYLATALGDIDASRAFSDEAFALAGDHPYDALPNGYCFAAINELYRDRAAALTFIDRAITIAPLTPSGTENLPFAHHNRAIVYLHAARWSDAVADAKVVRDKTDPSAPLYGAALVSELCGLLALGEIDGCRMLLADGRTAAVHGSNRWHLRLIEFVANEGQSALTADGLASEAMGTDSRAVAQRASDLLAALAWKSSALGGSSAADDQRWAAAFSSSPFGALAMEALRRERGWSDQLDREARIAAIAQTDASRSSAIRLVRAMLPEPGGRAASPA